MWFQYEGPPDLKGIDRSKKDWWKPKAINWTPPAPQGKTMEEMKSEIEQMKKDLFSR